MGRLVDLMIGRCGFYCAFYVNYVPIVVKKRYAMKPKTLKFAFIP